jgi:phosphopantothenoylcysteine decarboxylase/phosphopantothenate--cysteine ligase
MIKDKKILLGVTGGIAAYKAVDLASKLTSAGAIVKTILTKNACEIINPLTFKSITHQKVITKMFDLEADIEHISLADWADLVVIAPATANIIGKTASGIADDLLSTTIMATTAKVLFVPAMNIHMYKNPIVQENIKKLTHLGYLFMEPEYGKLACGYEGKGRFPQTKEIVSYIKTYLHYPQDLVGEKILITAGASREKLDPMRYITNFSSGKMGLSLAKAAYIRGAEVKLIHAAMQEEIPKYLDSKEALSAQEMYDSVHQIKDDYNCVIMCAAVADYSFKEPSQQKLKKGDDLSFSMVRTKDILKSLGETKKSNQYLVGFAAESENIIENAKSKFIKKNLDMIVANNLQVAGNEFSEITIITKNSQTKFSGSKFHLAHKILDEIFK